MKTETNNFAALPNDVIAERSILGAILLNNDVFDRVVETGLSASDFYADSNRLVFSSMQDMQEHRDPIDLVTLTSKLKARGEFERVGGSERNYEKLGI